MRNLLAWGRWFERFPENTYEPTSATLLPYQLKTFAPKLGVARRRDSTEEPAAGNVNITVFGQAPMNLCVASSMTIGGRRGGQRTTIVGRAAQFLLRPHRAEATRTVSTATRFDLAVRIGRTVK